MKVLPALEVAIDEQVRLFNDCFEGYLTGFNPLDIQRFGGLLRSGGIDLSRSLIAVSAEGAPAGLAYAGVFAGITRLAAMGVAAGQRRKGYAQGLLEIFIEQAKERLSETVVLEVFEQNIPAVQLYSKAGFATIQRLFGYSWSNQTIGKSGLDHKAGLADMLDAMMARKSYPEPYQFSPYALISEDGELQVRQHKTSWVAYKRMAGRTVLLKYLADERDDWNSMKELVWSVACSNRNCSWTVPQIVPEKIATEVLEPLGFGRLQLNQLQMSLAV